MSINDELIQDVLKNKHGNAFIWLDEMFWNSIITNALKLNNGSTTKAAEALGLDRKTLVRRIKTHGINVKAIKSGFDCDLRLTIIETIRTEGTAIKAAEKLGMKISNLHYHMGRLGIKRHSECM
jgi:transcriptional regulator with GAF, ATPase, and Fis domain